MSYLDENGLTLYDLSIKSYINNNNNTSEISEGANEEIERKFREEFIWTSFDGETFNVDLTPLKEQELKSLYNNLPFNYILGKNYEGHAFESSEELDDFFNKLEEFKQSCQLEIYAMVNAIDWNLYEQALEEAKNN